MPKIECSRQDFFLRSLGLYIACKLPTKKTYSVAEGHNLLLDIPGDEYDSEYDNFRGNDGDIDWESADESDKELA